MRKPDVDLRALAAFLARVLPGADPSSIRRAADGHSTQVYRVRRRAETFYVRIAETRDDSLAPEALAHGLLRARGVRVPEVVHLEPFDAALDRSAMVTTEIPGGPIARARAGVDVRPIVRAAGRDLALLGGVAVDGFGWIERDDPAPTRLTAELPSLRVFALDGLELVLATVRGLFTPAEIATVRGLVAGFPSDGDPRQGAAPGHLAHGDFDSTHVYHRDGAYTGVIDLGEIRGADRWYDLGHAALHDGETLPVPLLPHLLDGYAEVVQLPLDHRYRIALWSVLIGVRALARAAVRSHGSVRDHLARAIRRDLKHLTA